MSSVVDHFLFLSHYLVHITVAASIGVEPVCWGFHENTILLGFSRKLGFSRIYHFVGVFMKMPFCWGFHENVFLMVVNVIFLLINVKIHDKTV